MRSPDAIRYVWALLFALLPAWSVATQVITNTPNGTMGGSALYNNDWMALL